MNRGSWARSYERATSVTAAIKNMFTRLLDGTRAMLWGEDYRCYAEGVNVYRSEVTVNRLSRGCGARRLFGRADRAGPLPAQGPVVHSVRLWHCRHKVIKSFRSAVRDRSCQWARRVEQSERMSRLLAVLSDRQRETLVLRGGWD